MQMQGHELAATTVRELVTLRAAYGDKTFLSCQDRTLTYVEADRQSNRVAHALRDMGLAKGDVLATLMYNSVEHVLVWFACAKLGLVWAPLNVSLARDDLAYCLDDTAAKIVVVDAELFGVYRETESRRGSGITAVVLQDPGAPRDGAREDPFPVRDFGELLTGSPDLPDAEVTATDPAAIVYTGGSTGMPKGVLVPHLYYIGAALRYGEISGATPDDVHFANSHLFHSGGQQFGITGPMYHGMSTVMAKWFSASRYWDIVREHGVTIIDPLGTMIAVLLRAEPGERDRVHRVRVGVGIASGQVRRDLRDEFEERFGFPLLEVYSMTEMGVMICSEHADDRRPGSSGRPHGWAEICIVDEDDMPVAAGRQGQILLRPAALNTVMTRYLNKPEETIAAWRNLWYHTGDIGSLDEDGYLYFGGRLAHWIRRRGENVATFEVEQAITSHPSVIDCAVVGVLSDLGEEDVKAYVHLDDLAGPVPPEDLVAWCEQRIAYFKVPRYVEFVTEFPRTMTKREIARHELRAKGVGAAWDRLAADERGALRA
jgi:carnitine-CoA ligase